MLTKDEILNYLSENKDYLKKKYFIDKIGIIGSYARGDYNENSDVDLIVYFNKKADDNRIFRLYVNLQDELEKRFKKKVDIVVDGNVLPAFRDIISEDSIYV